MEELSTVPFLHNIQTIRMLKLAITQLGRPRKDAKSCAKSRRTVVKQTGIFAATATYIPMIKIWGSKSRELRINADVEQKSCSLDVKVRA